MRIRPRPSPAAPGVTIRYVLPVTLIAAHRQLLRDAARRAVEHGLHTGRELEVDALDYPEPLREPKATFVTLRHRGELLGCIGTLYPQRPLILDVVRNAYHAAFSDLRFEPVNAAQLAELDIHISILSPVEPMDVSSESELLAQLRVGVDGLIIADQGRTATFLPAMWERLSGPLAFLRALKEKAGLPPRHWSPTFRAFRYTVEDA